MRELINELFPLPETHDPTLFEAQCANITSRIGNLADFLVSSIKDEQVQGEILRLLSEVRVRVLCSVQKTGVKGAICEECYYFSAPETNQICKACPFQSQKRKLKNG